MGQSQTCYYPSPGHSAPDEVPGGEALLHEHQLGAGELQQVCSSRLPCNVSLLPSLLPPAPACPASASSLSIHPRG